MTLPLPARIYLWVVAAAAGVTLLGLTLGALVAPGRLLGIELPGAPLSSGLTLSPADWLLLAELIGLVVLAQHFPLSLGERHKLDLSDGVHYATVLLFDPAVAVAAVAVGEGIGQATLTLRRDRVTGRRRRGPHGALFNTSQFVLAVALAGLTRQALPGWAGILAAALVQYLTNSVLVAVMAALHQRKSPVGVWLNGRATGALQVGGFMIFGLLMAISARQVPWVPLLMAVPAALTYLSLRRTAAAEAAVRARDEFLGLASHELRTPLTSLRGYTHLLLGQLSTAHEPEPAVAAVAAVAGGSQGITVSGNGVAPARRLRNPELAERALRTIDRQTDRLCALIDQLLDVTRIQSGRLVLEPAVADVAEVARDVAASLQLITPDYQLVVLAPEPVYAKVDRPRLEQVLTNLINNAARYAGQGDRIDISVGRGAHERVELSVRDYGVGIAPEHRPRIFDRYYQAPNARRVGGLGMGLYICREIVERHGGTIRMDAPEDGGARFAITLPAATGEGQAAQRSRAGQMAATRPLASV